MAELTVFRDLVVLFGLGVAVVLAAHRIGIPPVVGFLVTGVLSGPYGFGLVRDAAGVEGMAQVGVVLLLFVVGIEFSVQRFRRLRTFVLLGGALQVGGLVLLTAAGGAAFGLPWRVALFAGMLMTLSSAAIVLRLLSQRSEVDAPHGRAALGILIFQTLSIVPMMLILPFLGGVRTGALDVVEVAVRALVFVGVAAVAARFAVPWLLTQVVRTRRREIFLLTILLLCAGMAFTSASMGLSLALGSFVAGLIVSESEYNHQALGEILPLREIFFSLFFLSIGMLFDVRTVLVAPREVLAVLGGAVLLKALVTAGVVWTIGQSVRVAVLAGIALAQVGEFSFVLARLGVDSGLLDESAYQIFLSAAVGSMALSPLLLRLAPRTAAWMSRRIPERFSVKRPIAGVTLREKPSELRDHVLLIGYGLNGRNVARVLERTKIPYIIIDLNPHTVRVESERGVPIMYGDSTKREVLLHAGIVTARVIVLAISDIEATRGTVDAIRRIAPKSHLVVRTQYTQEMEILYKLGASEVVSQEFETSIEIFSRVLERFLVPQDVIEQNVIEVRREAYEMHRSISRSHGTADGIERHLGNVSVVVYRVETGCPVEGQTLAESSIRSSSGASVVAIQRKGGDTVSNPSSEVRLEPGDYILLLGNPAELDAAQALFRRATPADETAGDGGSSSGSYRRMPWGGG